MYRWSALLLGLLLALPARAASDCLTLAFQGNVGGKVEDCGCPKRPLGGLAHRAKLISDLKADCSQVLLVDAGNMLGAENFEGGLAQTELLLRESAAMGYRVLGVGQNDLRFGLEFAQSIPERYGIQLVASNLLKDGKPAFPTSAIEQVGDLRVGFVSLLAWHRLPSEYDLKDPQATLAEILPELREQTDLIVLLSNLERGDTQKLLQKLPEDHGIDFALTGTSGDHWVEPHDANHAKLMAANPQGKYLGVLKLTLKDGAVSGDSQFTLQAVDVKEPADEAVKARVDAFVAERDAVAAGGPGR